MKNILCLIFLLCSFSSCRDYPDEVKEALLLSGDNRHELEKVLNYYRYKDKVAYESACFLIGNMKYHESEHVISPDTLYASFFIQTDSLYKKIFKEMPLNIIKSYKGKEYDSIRNTLGNNFQLMHVTNKDTEEKLSDLKNIKADFLINNIESALSIWKSQRYTYKDDFDFFKEFILPYRTTNEYPTHKRSTLVSMFHEILSDSVNNSIYTKIDRYKVYIDKCRWINKYVKTERHLGIYDLFIPKFKMDCHNMTNWSCNIFRSNGIPTVYEYTPLWKERDSKHFWCVSPDTSGILQPYTAPDNNLREDWESDIKYAGKVYRKTYGAQKNTPYFFANKDEYIPELFRKPLLSDQTFRYHPTITLRFPLRIDTFNKLAYLCMFTTQGLTPVAWGKIDHRKKQIIFEQVPLNTLFFPVCYDDESMLSISDPFLIYSSSQVQSIPLPLTINSLPHDILDLTVTDKQLVLTKTRLQDVSGIKYITLPCNKNKYIKMHLLRKYPEKRRMKAFQEKIKGAILVGSNQLKKGFDTLLILKQTPKPYLQDIPFENKKKYRYYRFFTADGSPINIAHIEFLSPHTGRKENMLPTPLPIFSKEEKKFQIKERLFRINGEPIKTGSQPEHAFDNNPNTYVGSSNIGMDFKKPVQITHIRFMPRTANNIIIPGNSYLLLYYDKGWKEASIVYAKDNYLDFNHVPKATLFWLQNLTEGKDELPFFYINGKQYFLHTDTLPNNFSTNE